MGTGCGACTRRSWRRSRDGPGRHTHPGTFGVTGEARPLDDGMVDAIENHRFDPIRKLHWRNQQLEFGSIDRLIGSLEKHTSDEWLTRVRESDDLAALKALAAMPEISDRVRTGPEVHKLWDVCRIPDFRGASATDHATLLARIFDFVHDGGRVPNDWMAKAIGRIDRTDGDIDAISKRLAYIRTWTYVAQRRGWVDDESHWRDETRAVEDRLSDALHACLTQRFVDRRTSVLMRRLKQKETLVAEVNDKGEVTVEGEFIGRLEGFRFRQDASASPDEARTLRQTAVQALRPEFSLRADRFYNSPDTELEFTEQGGLLWGTTAVGKLIAGAEALKPLVEPFVDEEAGPDVAEKVRRRLQHFIDRKVATLYEPLLAMSRDEALTGLARGFAFRMSEALGVLPRDEVADDVKALDQEARGALRKHGLRFGQFTIFLPLLLKPAPTRLRLVLWSLANGLQEFPESPPPGLVTIPNLADVPRGHYTLAGYRPAGARAIRIDMLERLADLLRAKDSRAGFEATAEMLSITGMTLDQFADLMGGLGYKAEKAERAKVKPESVMPEGVPAASATPERAGEVPGDQPQETPVEIPDESPAETPVEVPDEAPAEVPVQEPSEAPAEAPSETPPTETESYYLFTWAPRPRGGQERRGGERGGERGGNRSRGPRAGQGAATEPAQAVEGAPADGATRPARERRPQGERGTGERNGGERPQGERQDRGGAGKPKGKREDRPYGKSGDKGRPPREERAKSFESRPPRREADPDSPFAVLAALKDLK